MRVSTGADVPGFRGTGHNDPDQPIFVAEGELTSCVPDFIAMVEGHGIAWHEKSLGQLFCDNSAKDIIRMLLDEMRAAGVQLRLQTENLAVEKDSDGFRVRTSECEYECASLVVATGGKSIPKMGGTGFAYRIAELFGLVTHLHKVWLDHSPGIWAYFAALDNPNEAPSVDAHG